MDNKNKNLSVNLIKEEEINTKKKVKVVTIERTNNKTKEKPTEKTIENNISHNKYEDKSDKYNDDNSEKVHDYDRKLCKNFDPNYTPIIIFINKKSGSKEGEYILHLKPVEVSLEI